MSVSDLETIYDRLAETIDAVGKGKEALFLAKLVLLLVQAQDDADKVLALVDEAAQDLD